MQAIDARVNMNLLQASMRDVLINEPISTVAVLQGTSFGIYNALAHRAQHAPPVPQHIAYRMALLLRPDADSTSALLDHADSLSAHHGLPPAARVAVAGAAFERHLRALAMATGAVPKDIRKTQIGFLSGQLLQAGVFTQADFRTCGVIADGRDLAAHGWFEDVTDAKADRIVADMRRIVGAHPLPKT